MISTKRIVKLLSADEAEVEKTIESFSEKEAKELVRRLISFIKNYDKPTVDIRSPFYSPNHYNYNSY